jgi:hypothetical protein
VQPGLFSWLHSNAQRRHPAAVRQDPHPRTAQSFCVPKADRVANGYDLSINRYKEVVHAQVQHRAPQEILAELARLEDEITQGMKTLEGLLAKEV